MAESIIVIDSYNMEEVTELLDFFGIMYRVEEI